MSRFKSRSNNLLPLFIIEAAANGEVEAINKVLKFYENYIIALSTRRLYDENGKPYLMVDNERRRTLETNLIVRVLKFDITRAA